MGKTLEVEDSPARHGVNYTTYPGFAAEKIYSKGGNVIHLVESKHDA